MIATFQDTTSKIKPIETIYNGYRFRSRLEARWAVFFGTFGLTYEYEKEGYNLGFDEEQEFGYYLPDFYFPSLQTYCEIKPSIIDDRFVDPVVQHQKLISERFRTVVNTPILLLFGYPWDYEGIWYGWDDCNDSAGECHYSAGFMPGDLGNVYLILDSINPQRTFCLDCGFTRASKVYGTSQLSINCCFDVFLKHCTADAALSAKQARFEHGESP